MPGMIPRGARRPGACPRCGGTHLVRKGHDRGGSQGRSRGSCGRAPSRKAMGPLGCPEPEGGVWAGYAGHACAGGTPGECAGACGVCPGTSRLVRTGPSEAVGRALAPPGRGQPSPAKSTARTSASRRPAGGPGRRRRCPGSRGARRRRARARHIEPQGVRGRRGGRARHGGARRARGPRASWRASGGSRRGGPATTPAGSCGTSRRGGRTPTGRTPCRARRRRGTTTTRGSPSRGSRSPSGPTGRISWPCQRWSNRELTVYSSLKQQALNTSEAAYRDKLKD